MQRNLAEQFNNIAHDLSQAIDKQDHAGALYTALQRYATQAARLTIQLLDTDCSPKWDSLRERFSVLARPISDTDAWLGWRFAIGWMSHRFPGYVPSDACNADGVYPLGGAKKISLEQMRLWASNTVSGCRLMAQLVSDGQPKEKAGEENKQAVVDTGKGLECDEASGITKWHGRELPAIRGQALIMLKKLLEANGQVVSYVDLTKAINSLTTVKSIIALKQAPQEVKNARKTINQALSNAKVPFVVRAVNGKGMRLLPVSV